MKQQSPSKKSIVSCCRQAAGFTLIELLVAMAILMVIVLMLANLFQQSTRAWDIGMRQAEVGLEARAAINMIEQDLNQAVASTNANQQFTTYIAGSGVLSFAMFSRTNAAIERVQYVGSSSGLTRNGVQLLGAAVDTFTVTPIDAGAPDPSELPDLVEISLTMSSSKNFSEVRVYVQGREYEEGGTDWVDTSRGN